MNTLSQENRTIASRPRTLNEAVAMVQNGSGETKRFVSRESGLATRTGGFASREGEFVQVAPRSGIAAALICFTCLFAGWFMFAADFAHATAYKGKTKGGSSVTFNLKGKQAKGIRTVVPTLCLETTGGYSSRAGSELFQPVAAGRIGKTVKSKALQPAAMNQGIKATKNYEVTLGSKGRLVSGKLKVNFSFLIPDLYGMRIYICTGSTTFTARPR